MQLLRVTGWVIKFAEKSKSLKNPSYTYKHGVIMLYISILIPWYKLISPLPMSMKPKYYGFEMYKRIF